MYIFLNKKEQLQKLVSHYEKEIEKEKLEKYKNVMENIENNEFEELQNVQKQKEKQLEALTNKLNGSECEKNIKYEIVKAQRRERILNSNQFNGFENEIFDLEYKYKQFFIERVFLEKLFEEKQQEFTKMKTEWEKQLKGFEQKSQRMYEEQIMDNCSRDSNFVDSEDSNYFGRTQNGLNKQSFYRSRAKMNFMRNEKKEETTQHQQMNELNEKRISNLESLKIVKNLLNDLGVNSFHDLKQSFKSLGIISHETNKLSKLELINEQKTEEILKIEDEIYEWAKNIDTLEYNIEHHIQHNINLNPPKASQINGQEKSNKSKINNIKLLESSYDKQIEEIVKFNSSEELKDLMILLGIDQETIVLHEEGHEQHTININLLSHIQEKFTEVVGPFSDSKSSFRNKNDRKSIICWEMPHLQQQEKDSNLTFTQKSICPLLEPTKSHQSKRVKSGISQQVAGHNGLKKLSNLLKNQSRMRGPIEIVSKDQMIKQASEAFDKEGLSNMEKFEVKYM